MIEKYKINKKLLCIIAFQKDDGCSFYDLIFEDKSTLRLNTSEWLGEVEWVLKQ